VHEFVDEIAALNRWLGRDILADVRGVVPTWTGFRFRDAAVFQLDAPENWGRMYLVRGGSVREFALSQVSIDQAYLQLDQGDALPAAV
jgi:hypothetical protein